MLDLKIVTLEGIIFSSKEIKSATIPTVDGEITVLPKHAPLISVLKKGLLTLREEKTIHKFEISAGVLEVRHKNLIVILTDSAGKF